MLDYREDIIKEMEDKEGRRSDIIWSAGSITGYIWDFFRNTIVLLVVLAIYDNLRMSSEVIMGSLLILIYLSVISTGAIITQSVMRNGIAAHSYKTEVLKKIGKEDSEDDKKEFEKANFLFEKMMYKFYLNSFFSFIIFIIVLINLFGVL
ncbi:MAG: hypothetical protein AAB569_04495 [Patescibacteria group bacterium]